MKEINVTGTWIARLVSLAIFAGLFASLTMLMPVREDSKSVIRIQTDSPKSEILKKLVDSGIDVKQVDVQETPKLTPIGAFVSAFVGMGIGLAIFMVIHLLVKAVLLKPRQPNNPASTTDSGAPPELPRG
jgi:hypothetical protein